MPQSFSPTKGEQKNNIEKDKQHTNENNERASQFDLNTCSNQLMENNASIRSENDEGEGALTLGLGYVKFKARRAGFKPYKRCSMEAKDSRLTCTNNQDEVKCPKRMRVEGGTSG